MEKWINEIWSIHTMKYCSAIKRNEVLIQASLVTQLVKNHLQCKRHRFNPWVGKIPWRRERLPIPVFWPGECHGLSSPWGCKESVITEWLSFLLIQATIWMNLENVMPSERNQTQKATYCMTSFLWTVQKRSIHGVRKRITGCQGLRGGGVGDAEWVPNRWWGRWGSFRMMGMFWN